MKIDLWYKVFYDVYYRLNKIMVFTILVASTGRESMQELTNIFVKFVL